MAVSGCGQYFMSDSSWDHHHYRPNEHLRLSRNGETDPLYDTEMMTYFLEDLYLSKVDYTEITFENIVGEIPFEIIAKFKNIKVLNIKWDPKVKSVMSDKISSQISRGIVGLEKVTINQT